MSEQLKPWYLKNAKLDGGKYSALPKEVIAEAYYNGDHFSAGNEILWIGALPDSGGQFQYNYILSKIQKIFTSHNKVKECVNRYLDSLLNNEIIVTSPNEAAATFINSWMEDLIDSSLHMNTDETEECFRLALRSALVLGSGYIRVFIRDEFTDPLRKLAAHSVHPSRITLYYTPNGLLEGIEYLMSSKKVDGRDKRERQVLDFKTGLTTFYVYENPEDFDAGNFLEEPVTIDLDYSFTIHKITMPSMITESVKELQNAINLFLTMIINNTVDAGFLERLILNAQLPGDVVNDPQSGDVVFVPKPERFKTGTGQVTFLSGIPLENSEGEVTSITTPSVQYQQPIDNTNLHTSLELYIKLMYLEFNQGHILASDDGSLSGRSRIQLKQDFDKTLSNLVKLHKALVLSVVKTIGHLAGYLGAIPVGVFKGKKSVALEYNQETNLLTEEIKEIRENFVAKIVSHRTTLAKLGHKDPDLELDQINKEQAQELKTIQDSLEEVPTSSPVSEE
jgi:hypothetical protein